MIEVSHLTRRFGPHVAVDDLSFRLEAGEVVGFLGPNGAGKTTTMRMLTGFLPATRGSVAVAGYDVLRRSMEVRRRVGYLPEAVPLYRELRVEEMLRFQALLHGIPRNERKARIGRVLERVGLTDRRRSLVGSLSRGLRQRAGLAVCLLPDPQVLILDEPTSGLDPLQRIEVRALVKELAAERTVLLSSHILAEVEDVCPRVIVIHKGRCLADGRPEELVTKLTGVGAHVRVEAVVPDPVLAQRLFASLPGVREVELTDRVGIHQGFAVRGEGDLREDVGALCAAKGFALRELSWVRPSLESLFAALVIGEDLGDRADVGAVAPGAPSNEPTARAGAAESPGLLQLAPDAPPPAAPPDAGSAPPPAPPPRTLNPFERGGGS